MSSSKKRVAGGLVASVLVLVAMVLVVAVSYATSKSAGSPQTADKPMNDPSIAREVSAKIEEMMQPEVLDSGPSAMGGLSSNPYDYAKDNPRFIELVALGYDALPALEAELGKSEESGLREYMICIAMEQITGCDLKQYPDSHWDTARAFKTKWPAYLKSIPGRAEEILTSDADPIEKNEAIAKLGAPAVPFVIDNLGLVNKSADPALTSTLARLMKDSRKGSTIREFASQNADEIAKLRAYVLNR